MKNLLSTLLLVSAAFGTARADVVCPDSSTVTVTFGNNGDRFLVAPRGDGDSLVTFVDIRVCLKNCDGAPLAGVPAEVITLENEGLCVCPGGNIAAAPTDANGCTRFAGPLRAGGCVEYLNVVADGVDLGSIPVKTSSPDFAPASPCNVDASDLSFLVFVLGRPDRYTPCADFNGSGGPTIDASDFSRFAHWFRARCQ